MAISSFTPPTATTNNLPGYVAFQFLEVAGISAIPEHYHTYDIDSAISLNGGYSWLTGYATRGTLQYTEQQESAQGVPVISHQLSGFVPGDNATLAAQLAEMVHYRYVVLATDSNGQKRVVGSKERPLAFSWQYDSQLLDGNAVKGYRWSFTGASDGPAPIYSV